MEFAITLRIWNLHIYCYTCHANAMLLPYSRLLALVMLCSAFVMPLLCCALLLLQCKITWYMYNTTQIAKGDCISSTISQAQTLIAKSCKKSCASTRHQQPIRILRHCQKSCASLAWFGNTLPEHRFKGHSCWKHAGFATVPRVSYP